MATVVPSFRKMARSDVNVNHEVLIAVAQNNLDYLKKTIIERGTPGHKLYQQWLSFDEIRNLTKNDAAYTSIITWLKSSNVSVTWSSPRLDYIRASATIGVWEVVLNTTFFEWELNKSPHPNMLYHRSLQYYVPKHLNQHVSAIFNTCQAPQILTHFSRLLTPSVDRETKSAHLTSVDVDVPFLNSLYKITDSIGSTNIAQAVFQTNGENYQISDLVAFQQKYDLLQQKAKSVGSTPSTSCTTRFCSEGSLDLQYIMGIAQNVSSVFWSISNTFDDPFLEFILQVAVASKVPTSLSISWGGYEYQFSDSELDTFNTEALKISLMGVTIFASSGDDGVSGYSCKCSTNSYYPMFPASSPYVVAVGATQGPENGSPEIACSSSTGGLITTGGGFSSYYSQPAYQAAAVSAYFDSPEGQSAQAGYNTEGRGYPDISFIGVYYPVIIGGTWHHLYGTSASAPLAAAMISLINSRRAEIRLPPVGFILPTLYGNASRFNDVTSGSNNCCQSSSLSTSGRCCNSGFLASKGWDPVTGLGSINFPELFSLFYPGATVSPSRAPTPGPLSPTISPTQSPTAQPSTRSPTAPTARPTTARPTVSFRPTTSHAPSAAPSAKPQVPTRRPSKLPSTTMPTISPSLSYDINIAAAVADNAQLAIIVGSSIAGACALIFVLAFAAFLFMRRKNESTATSSTYFEGNNPRYATDNRTQL